LTLSALSPVLAQELSTCSLASVFPVSIPQVGSAHSQARSCLTSKLKIEAGFRPPTQHVLSPGFTGLSRSFSTSHCSAHTKTVGTKRVHVGGLESPRLGSNYTPFPTAANLGHLTPLSFTFLSFFV
jgi:hypothetical protein